MKIPDYAGDWTGVIILGKGYNEDEGEKIYFDLEIKQEGSKITGTATDIKGFAINPDPAKITGKINSQGTISFLKQYPSFHYSSEGEEFKIDRSQPGPIINYHGVYNSLNGTFRGTWEIRGKRNIFKVFSENYVLASGTWGMERKQGSLANIAL